MLKVLQMTLCLVLASVPARAQSIAGDWLGTLDAGAIKLRLVFHIAETEKGLTATLDSLDQNAKGLPVSGVTLNESAVKLEMPKLGATFEGQRSADGARIDGTFKRSRPWRWTRSPSGSCSARRPSLTSCHPTRSPRVWS